MKQITLNSLLLSALLALGLAACDSKSDLEPGSLTGDTAAVLNLVKDDGKMSQSSPYRITPFVISDPEITSQDVVMNVQLFRPAEETRKVTLAVDKEAANRYQQLQGQAYKLLDPSMITLPEQVVVKKGATYSDNFTIKAGVPETLEPNTKYLFAIALTEVECSKVIRPIHSIALFTVERFVESDVIIIRLNIGDHLHRLCPLGTAQEVRGESLGRLAQRDHIPEAIDQYVVAHGVLCGLYLDRQDIVAIVEVLDAGEGYLEVLDERILGIIDPLGGATLLRQESEGTQVREVLQLIGDRTDLLVRGRKQLHRAALIGEGDPQVHRPGVVDTRELLISVLRGDRVGLEGGSGG